MSYKETQKGSSNDLMKKINEQKKYFTKYFTKGIKILKKNQAEFWSWRTK